MTSPIVSTSMAQATQSVAERDPFAQDDAVMQAQATETGACGPTDLDPTLGGPPGLGAGLPPDWPDERGFIPPGPRPVRPMCIPQNGPVMTHTRIYHGADAEFSEALASYYPFPRRRPIWGLAVVFAAK